VRLIASGDTIGLATVGTIRGAAWRGDRPIAVDEKNVWNLDPATGTWSAEALGTFDATGYVDIGAVETFEQNLYMFTPESGKILKFQAGAYDGNPDDWANGEENNDLSKVVDFAIDGHIWALTSDGGVLDMFRSRVEADLKPVYMPPLDSASAIVTSINGAYLYVLNASDGRIVRLTRDGRIVQQFTAADSAPTLNGATDFVVDDSTGIAFIVANDTLFSVRLPAPPS
jgi:outer membrane protein assembly factor BamB